MEGGSFSGDFEGNVLKKVRETDACLLRDPLRKPQRQLNV
jgi:hypothetical protein